MSVEPPGFIHGRDSVYRYLDDEAVTAELSQPILTGSSYLRDIVINAIRSIQGPQLEKLLSHKK